jgi:histidine ammonia-lyase
MSLKAAEAKFLSVDTYALIVLGRRLPRFEYSADELARVEEAFQRWGRLKQECQIYGYHTGFGSNVDLPPISTSGKHQLELLDFLRVGRGPLLPESVVRRALKLQLRKVTQGLSAISPAVFCRLVELANSEDLPDVPAYGSLGASGDLIPMAHAVAPVFRDNSIEQIGDRDVLGLVNTNAMMSSWALELLDKVSGLFSKGLQLSARVAVAINSRGESFGASGFVHRAVDCAVRRVAELLEGYFREYGGAKSGATRLQDRYSVRCAPQVYGNALELIKIAEGLIFRESVAVADNPLVLQDSVWHGGHFYSAQLASAADLLISILVRMADISDRQGFLLVDAKESDGLADNLYFKDCGHVKGLHQLVNALMQRVRALATTSWQVTSSAEGNNQDVLPGTMTVLNCVGDLLPLVEEITNIVTFMAERGCQLRLLGHVLPSHSLEAWREGTRR